MRGVTVTRRGAAWTILAVILAGLGALAGYCAVSSRITGSQAFGVLILVAAAAVDSLWLRRNKLHHPGRHRS